MIEFCSRERSTVWRWDSGPVGVNALALRVNKRMVYRWLAQGLTANQADAVSIMLGRHPSAIWPDWFAFVPSDDYVRRAEAVRERRLAMGQPWRYRRRGPRPAG